MTRQLKFAIFKRMLESNRFLQKSSSVFVGFSAFIFLLVIFLNDGFMALDEYWVGITRYIPAQTSSVETLVRTDDVKSPLQMMPMHGVAQLALAMGFESPYAQYRAVISVLAILNFVLMIFAFLKFAEVMSLSKVQKNFLLLLLTLYFGSSFSFTRPMYESIAAPWLALAAVWALRYDFYGRTADLVWGVVFASIAFVLRQQLGFCALVFIWLPILKKNWRHLFIASGVGLFFLIISGIPDYYLRGQFHFSLLNLTIYNYQHGADYGRKPITFYPLLVVVMTFLPFFIKKYPKEIWQTSFHQQRTLWVILFLFIFLHSLFPQKWERFMISVIPILLFLVFPYLLHLQQNFHQHKARLIGLYSLNGLVFVIASFFPPQKNLIEMSRYLNLHPEIQKIHRVNNTPEWITDAFILNKRYEFIESNAQLIHGENWADCSKALVLATRDVPQFQDVVERLQLKAQFSVNLIEQLAYKMNPKNNARRVQLNLYSGCVEKSTNE